MPVTYAPWLVALSVVLAIQGAYVGLTLAVQVGDAAGLRRRMLLAGAAFSLAVAIWTMHFVGMLAARLPFQVDYLVFPTLLSFLVCVIVVGAAVYATSSGPLTLPRLTFASCLMGGGIFSMHCLGMEALAASAAMIHARVLVAASMAIAIAASGLALWLAAGRGGRPPLILSATVFGLAVSGMHYTAMAGVTLYPLATTAPGAPALSTDLLAIVVAIVAFCVSGIFLLALVPDRVGTQPQATMPASPPLAAAAPTPAEPAIVPPRGPAATAVSDKPAADDPEWGHGTYAPLGGAGVPRRIARHLPVEREGGKQFVPIEEVVAIQASAHYTTIFNGRDRLFCPLAIGEVESRLDAARFMRVHRSHIVNIERVAGCRRSGDSDSLEMEAEVPYTVPVSRSRIGRLKSRIAQPPGSESAVPGRRRPHLATP